MTKSTGSKKCDVVEYVMQNNVAVVGNSFCSLVVENWSSNPEDAGTIPSEKALELHFSQLVPVWLL